MRKDDKVFVMGEEVGEYQGAYKITRGLLQEFGSDRFTIHLLLRRVSRVLLLELHSLDLSLSVNS